MQNLSYSPFLLPHCVQNVPIPSLTVRQTLHCMPVYLPVGPDVMRDGVFRKHGWFRRGFTPSVGGWPLKTTTETALCKPFLKSATTSDHLRNRKTTYGTAKPPTEPIRQPNQTTPLLYVYAGKHQCTAFRRGKRT